MGEVVTGAQAGAAAPARRLSFKPVWLFYGVLLLFLAGVVAFATLRPILVLPRITLAPGFALTDQDGSRLTNEDMRGKLVLYNLTYTDCAEPCPPTSTVMQEVAARLPELENGTVPVELVTISIDPQRDTPERLAQYAAGLDADTSRWHFVTGPLERLKWVIGSGFRVYFDHKEDGRIVFDPAFMLVDGMGILRAEYRTAAPGADRILGDMQLVLDEIARSKGANKVAYEAAHLFMCYPRG